MMQILPLSLDTTDKQRVLVLLHYTLVSCKNADR